MPVKALAAVVLLPLMLLAGGVAVATQQSSSAACWTAPATEDAGSASLDSAQVANARIIVSVAVQRSLPPRAAVIAVATAWQESRLRNLRHGDRDSLGLFQQRPSQGWGTPAEILDPVAASGRFYERLAHVPGWEGLALTDAAQAVQRSAFPDAYARWETLAQGLIAAYAPDAFASLPCAHEDPTARGDESGPLAPEQMGLDGLTPRTRATRNAIMSAFGVRDIGGYCPGGCRTGHIPGSDHYTGHAIDVMLTPMTAANRALGDQIAAWLVANEIALWVKYVIWYDRIWTPSAGWHAYVHPSGDTTSPTLAHRDHVHVSIE